ncbi:hypothetical protein HCH_03050 [Hahella chejuensis KCTC 2396]|uniref:Uncharacterized protein n=1 Tax=Hahella chejuensis (strain KCTC 2396) TaxID=349521 RepID=Q2SHQ8_HAHCH|nr:hypothetical protein HCH_03050 [Hahella chejuensis KCTC 2396]
MLENLPMETVARSIQFTRPSVRLQSGQTVGAVILSV